MKSKFDDGKTAVLSEVPRQESLPAQVGASPWTEIFRLHRILVPIDYSECSKKALQYAIPFARQFGAELTLLNVAHPYVVPVVPLSPIAPLPVPPTAENEQELKELQKAVGNSIATKTVTRTGTPWVEIVAAATDQDVDLIILSTHGRTGLGHALLGSTTEKVVRHARCPVLVVREREHDFVVHETR
ncbi:MAG TPA: universal stress protein [Candidatus Acidoferrales bacterium]|nr:universal stress protein [Candidatus Acidoferrales bacterium]